MKISNDTRRTILAGERTYLAWWRTGMAALTVALAAARVIPELSDASTQWPYTVLGLGFAALGILALAQGERLRRHVQDEIASGEFSELDNRLLGVIGIGGLILGLGLIVVIVVAP